MSKGYMGTKRINGTPMNRANYNELRGWDLPDDEDGNDEGYLVEYLDGGEPNHSHFVGYISWSPKEQFEKAYQANGELSFGHAIKLMKEGHKVARSGWNGKDMWVRNIEPYSDRQFRIKEVEPCEGTWLPFLIMKTVDNTLVPWLASQTDMLANDWLIV